MMQGLGSWPALGLVLITATAIAWLLRRAAFPGGAMGAATAAGVLAGLLTGQSVLGRLAPQWHSNLHEGHGSARQALASMRSRHGAEVLVAQQAGWSSDELAELAKQHGIAIEPVRAAAQAASDAHRRPFRLAALAAAALVLLGSGAFAGPVPRERQRWMSALNIGFGYALVPMTIAFAISRGWWRLSIAESLWVAAAVSIGPWSFTIAEQRLAERAETDASAMLRLAGHVGTLLAVVLAVAAMLASPLVAHGWPLLALPLGWLLAWPLSRRAPLVRRINEQWIVPFLAASVTSTIDAIDATRFWPLVILLLLSDDGRSVGGLLGAMLPGGRDLLRSMGLVLATLGTGPTQLAMIAIAHHAGLMPAWAAWPLLLGVVLIEASADMRRRMAGQIETWRQEL